MSDCEPHKECRLCGSARLERLLELTPTPPANEYVSDAASSLRSDRFPLCLLQCPACGHVQLSVVVRPERLFSNYAYLSGTSTSLVDHFRGYAESMTSRFGMGRGHLVVDVGSNDGTLLRFFMGAGMRVLGVDPAENLAGLAAEAGVETLPRFFTPDLAGTIASDYGRASLITANNVFAHADDLRSMASAARGLLQPFGIFVFEVQYLVDMCEKGLFDMVYHEHLSYHHVGPLIPFFESMGMRLFDVERIGTHGGSIRCFVDSGKREISPRVGELCRLEHSLNLIVPGWHEPEFDGFNAVVAMGHRINVIRKQLPLMIRGVRDSGGKIAGYGAPAKATTLIHHLGITEDDIEYVVDDNPLKQGCFIPGTGIPIVSRSMLDEATPDYLIVLAWNIADSIVEKCSAFKAGGGKFIVPLPEPKEINL